MQKKLPTWANKSDFKYDGSLQTGLVIYFGSGYSEEIKVPKTMCQQLLAAFSGKTVPMGTSRTSPPSDSVGSWLKSNVSKTAIASYVGAILLHEKYAVRGIERGYIRIK